MKFQKNVHWLGEEVYDLVKNVSLEHVNMLLLVYANPDSDIKI